ncbi:MAG: glycosyltransferase family 4 protein [Micromonosporaceae bacterium]
MGGDAVRERLRVALVLGASTGGIGRHVRALAHGLTAQGIAVTICCPAETAARFDFAAVGRVVALEIPAGVDTGIVPAVRDLRRELRAHPVDVVHAHGLRAGLIAALARPPRLVVSWHNAVLGQGARTRALRLGERVVARRADVTLAASPDLAERARALGGRDVRLGEVAAPVRVPRPGAAAAVRRELDTAARPLVLSVGRLHPQKGYDVLVAAAARWRELEPTPIVVIAGTGPAYRDLAAQIFTARAPVSLLGYRTDVADLLAAADVAVVSSVWEARQLFAQEALAAGVPLVATEVGGVPGLVGDAALLIPPGDVDALDQAVRRLLADGSLRARLAAAGPARAARWPTEAETVGQVVAVYAELCAPARQPDPAGPDEPGTRP